MSGSSSEVDSDDSSCVHLFVLIHGMWGNPTNLAEMRRILEETRGQGSERGPHGERLHILVADTNRDEGTYDGIDWGGERVAEEIYGEVKKLTEAGKKVTRFSVMGYSLGGLISRYVVGILHQRGFFEEVAPVNFNTIATPHIGLPRYRTFISGVLSYLGPKLLSRTGEQFYVVDKWSKNGRPLLEVMADPDRIFFQSLTLFEHVRIYANAVNDVTVPYVTAAIESEDPFHDHRFNGIHIEHDDKYSPILKSYTFPPADEPRLKPRAFTVQWFKNLKSDRPLFPPFLQFPFPLNLLLILITPVLLPVAFSLVFARFALASRASRARIKLLEEDAEQTSTERLVHVLGRLEHEMEAVAIDILEAPDPSDSISIPAQSSSAASTLKTNTNVSKTISDPAEQTPEERMVLADLQLKLVGWLNTLPGLKKELAFIHPVRNSHGVIIARDVKRFEVHKLGEGVLRHWAAHCII